MSPPFTISTVFPGVTLRQSRVFAGLDHFLMRNPAGDPARSLERDRRLHEEVGPTIGAFIDDTLGALGRE